MNINEVIEEVRKIRAESFGKDEKVYSLLGQAMGRLIDAKRLMK